MSMYMDEIYWPEVSQKIWLNLDYGELYEANLVHTTQSLRHRARVMLCPAIRDWEKVEELEGAGVGVTKLTSVRTRWPTTLNQPFYGLNILCIRLGNNDVTEMITD